MLTDWPTEDMYIPQAKLSAYYKNGSGKLSQLDAWIAVDPEGVTDEDVQRLLHESYTHLYSEDISFVEPVLVLIRGSKV